MAAFRLRRRGIELIPDGDTLAYRGPRGVLTPELRDAIASDKPGLLALLRGEAVSDSLPGGCIHQRFEAQARRRPQAVAVTSEDGELTYGELNTRANRLAHHLLGLGVRTESRVGVCLPSGLEMVVAMLGILKAGGAYVPVEPTWSGPLLGALFSDAEIAVCVTGESIQTRLPAGAARVICLDPASATLAAVSDRDPGGWVETANLAYVMYRSAPTGQGLRGVATEHRAVVDRLLALGRRVDVTADDVLLAIQPPSSVMAPLEVLLPLGAGARLALGRRRTVAEGRDLSADLRECGATLLLATPSICRQLLAAGGSGTTGLRLLCGGEPMSSELARQVRAAGLSLWNLYGCAESMLSSTLDEVDGPGASAPLGHTQIHVLDTHLQPVPIGVTGEIHISGASLARGCWKRPALTAAQFIPSPFAPEGGARLYRTGDLARRRADGRIEWVGRIDGQARVRGYRIDASTVEVVLRTHPAVWEAVAVVRDNPPAASRLVAYLVPRRGAALSAAEMPGFVRGKLPPHLEPADYVLLEELPLTSDGKVDRRALPPPARGPREDDMDAACARTNLTKNQFLIWAGQQLQPEVPLYNITALFTIPGPVDRRHFQIAFQALVDGSDALRTVIEEVEGLPRRRVLPQVRYVVEGPDFSPSADPEARLRAWATERAQQPFDLGVRLFEAALAKVAEDRFVWLFKHHHLISDAWTIALCVRYATEFYRRSRAGTLAGAPTLPPYEEFVAYERAQADSALYGKAKAYWERKLAEEVEPLVLYGNTGPRRTTRVERISHDLGMERSRRLRALAASEVFATASANVGLLSLFVALFLTYLFRISGNRRLALGTPILNRPSRAFKDTVGLFMQFAPLHVSLDEGETFVSLIPKVRQELYEVLRHQRYTTANPPQRRRYEVVFNYNHSNNPVGWHFDGATVSTESVHPGHENDSLALQVHDYDAQGSFVIDFDFHCEVFTPAQRRQTIEHVLRVIDVFCEDPTRPLREVDVLTAAERRHLLREFARSRALPPGPDSIVSVWQEQAGRTPEAAAVVNEGAQLTYRGARPACQSARPVSAGARGRARGHGRGVPGAVGGNGGGCAGDSQGGRRVCAAGRELPPGPAGLHAAGRACARSGHAAEPPGRAARDGGPGGVRGVRGHGCGRDRGGARHGAGQRGHRRECGVCHLYLRFHGTTAGRDDRPCQPGQCDAGVGGGLRSSVVGEVSSADGQSVLRRVHRGSGAGALHGGKTGAVSGERIAGAGGAVRVDAAGGGGQRGVRARGAEAPDGAREGHRAVAGVHAATCRGVGQLAGGGLRGGAGPLWPEHEADQFLRGDGSHDRQSVFEGGAGALARDGLGACRPAVREHGGVHPGRRCCTRCRSGCRGSSTSAGRGWPGDTATGRS